MEDRMKIYFFQQLLRNYLESELLVQEVISMSGGCINKTVGIKTDHGNYLVKYNDKKYLHMFEMEKKGLQDLASTKTFKVPKAYHVGVFDEYAFILMEFVHAERRRKDFWYLLGHQLAEMHLENTQSNYGLKYNNFIGPLNQSNKEHTNWLDFFVDERLLPQFHIAVKKGLIAHHHIDEVEGLKQKLSGVFPDDKPTLIHGDLWSGNVIVDQLGEPCLIDPAIYYGHREIEIAFTRLFGGFDQEFYNTYQETYPLHKGFFEREEIYNLYPLMVHTNLFGLNYFKGVKETLKKISS